MASSDADRSKDLQDLHNKGQEDASTGNYSPPHSTLSGVGDFLTSGDKEWGEHIEEDKAYDAGWANGRSQS